MELRRWRHNKKKNCIRGFHSDKEKPININILDATVSGTKRNRARDKRDPSPGQIGTRPWDKPASLCLIPQ